MTDAQPGGTPPAQPAGTAQPAQPVQTAQAPQQTQALPSSAAPRPRPRRRRSPWRTAFFGLAGAGIVAAVAWALLGGRLFVVRSISVSGTRLVTQAQVVAAADVPLGTPLLDVNAGAVTRRVEAIRQVASATVAKDWPDHLAITVTERVPAVAVRMSGGGYDLVDGTGVIVRWTRAKPGGLPVFQTSLTGTALRGDPGVAAVAAVLRELEHSLATQVVKASAAPALTGDGGSVVQAQRVTLVLRDGTTVLWGGPDDAAQKNRELQIVLKNRVREVDVSAPGTVVTS
jgi:cell division protein FtsQ